MSALGHVKRVCETGGVDHRYVIRRHERGFSESELVIKDGRWITDKHSEYVIQEVGRSLAQHLNAAEGAKLTLGPDATLTIWHAGSPRHVGWWYCKRSDDTKAAIVAWRWWDGMTWSIPATDAYTASRAAACAGQRAYPHACRIEWSNYYPSDARVPRHNPNICHAGRDGECRSYACLQLRDGEPLKTGRHCPLDTGTDDDA